MNSFLSTIAVLVLVAALLWCGVVAIVAVVFRRRDPVDDDAGVQLGSQPIVGEVNAAEVNAGAARYHFVSVCAQCHTVITPSDGPVRLGDQLRLSHGLCKPCAQSAEAELDRVLPRALPVTRTSLAV